MAKCRDNNYLRRGGGFFGSRPYPLPFLKPSHQINQTWSSSRGHREQKRLRLYVLQRHRTQSTDKKGFTRNEIPPPIKSWDTVYKTRRRRGTHRGVIEWKTTRTTTTTHYLPPQKHKHHPNQSPTTNEWSEGKTPAKHRRPEN